MRIWSTRINGNDIFHLIHQSFFDLYHQGLHPEKASRQVFIEFAAIFDNVATSNHAFFALALAQWETKTLEQWLLNEVRRIIYSRDDIILWRNLGANPVYLQERKIELEKFLLKISTEKENAKSRHLRKSNMAFNKY